MSPCVLRLLVIACLACGAASLITNSPRVELEAGKLRGKYVVARSGRRLRAFLGIPYAQPPLGHLRLKNPEPMEQPWGKERWAVDHPRPCVQPGKPHGNPIGQEDCLYLNVYVPTNISQPQDSVTIPIPPTAVNSSTTQDISSNEIPSNTTPEEGLKPDISELLPVMVFFHGGAFEMGKVEPFTPEFLVDGGVILVTVQYRLGLLGFLSTGDEALPGNLGFKDQQLALRWVHDNVQRFGGAPDRVVIFGEEAGAISVHYHMLFTSPKKAMFRGGISMSGTALSPWAFRSPHEVASMVDRLSELADCPRASEEFVDCLREKPAEELVELLQKYKEDTQSGCGDWALALPALGGVLENSSSADAFITGNPWDERVVMPWVVGATSKEMLYDFTPQLTDRTDTLFKDLDECFNQSLPRVLGYPDGSPGLVEAVRKFYLKEANISRELLPNVVDAVSDGSVVYPIYEAVKRSSRRSTWLYFFSYVGANTYGPSALDGRIGAGRGDDLFYLFARPLGLNVPRKMKDPDTAMSRQMVKLWTNFAKSLKPAPSEADGIKWTSTALSTTYLSITQDKMRMEKPFLYPRMSFWTSHQYPHRDRSRETEILSSLKNNEKKASKHIDDL